MMPRTIHLLLSGLALTVGARADLVTRVDAQMLPPAKGASVRVRADQAPLLMLEEGAEITFPFQVPPPPEAEGVDPHLWFLRFDLDVESASRLAITWHVDKGVTARRWESEWRGVRGRDHARWGGQLGELKPVACHGGLVTVTIAATGGPAALGELLVTRHHREPTEKLRGKENGKLGPDLLSSGMLGFTALTEHGHAAFSILEVRDGLPGAAGGLATGDVVVEVEGERMVHSSIAPGWEWFEESHEAVLGRAIEAALVNRRERVELTVERGDKLKRLKLRLPIERAPDSHFPLRGRHADRFAKDLTEWAVTHQKKDGTWKGTNAVNVAMGALALLGRDPDAHAASIERATSFLLEKNPRPSEMTGLAYWTIAFQGILLCELQLRSPDERYLAWIQEASAWLPTTTHRSKWGMQAFGHGPDGLPYGDKALMAPTAHLLVFDALARRCGVESRIYEHIEPYVRHSWSDPESGGHGAMGYNRAARDKNQFWSRTGLVALAEVLRGDEGGMARHLCVLMEERHPWMLNSHAYGEPGAALGLLSLATVNPELFEELIPLYRWRFLNAWEPGHGLRYTSPHMGAPYMGEEAILNLVYLLLLATEHEGLVVAGKE